MPGLGTAVADMLSAVLFPKVTRECPASAASNAPKIILGSTSIPGNAPPFAATNCSISRRSVSDTRYARFGSTADSRTRRPPVIASTPTMTPFFSHEVANCGASTIASSSGSPSSAKASAVLTFPAGSAPATVFGATGRGFSTASPIASECGQIIPRCRESRHVQRFSTFDLESTFSPARYSVSPARTRPSSTGGTHAASMTRSMS